VRGVLKTEDVGEEAKFQERLDEHGTHEVLFCHRAIICEGKDDEYAVRLYLQKSGVDVDGRSVSIIGVGGIENIPEYARIACRLGIPWFAITDEDRENGGIKPKTKAVRDKLAALARVMDHSEFWPASLEACLGLQGGQKAKPDWQRKNVEPKELSAIKQDHPDFAKIGESLRLWIEQPATIQPCADPVITLPSAQVPGRQ
jgi:predicted ATP-dependent endonuclease of OLD family